ncbi:RING finger protein 227 [Xyrichtys novacula]|uniref:RING finger protein 227 n=1 Tax=Xyrichtys novacula TaxID=13765 RepID=A0AAV1HJI6_XYRNO|nr:RING finger protein 227 [Xyrichtys novacula]
MYTDLECGICYWNYNAGVRCPRELHCKHSFCESCLLALSQPLQGGPGDEAHSGADRSIVCPLCRDVTIIPGERTIRAELRVDECALERLLEAGILEREEEDQEEGRFRDGCDDHDKGTFPETPAEEGDSSPDSTDRGAEWSWSKLWRKIRGKKSRRNCRPMSQEDMRHFAMMASYMF